MIGVTFVLRSRWRRHNRSTTTSNPPAPSSGMTQNPVFDPPIQSTNPVFESAVVINDESIQKPNITEKDEKVIPQVVVRKVSGENGAEWIVIGDGSDSDDLE